MKQETFEIPHTAQYYLPLKSNKEVATMFYRWRTVNWNDGTSSELLQYLSECGGGWFASDHNGKDAQQFVSENLVKI